MRTIPAVREVYKRYAERGLQVVGVHSPEFDEEHDLSNVKKAIARLDVPYPVAIDNDFRIWKSFGNRYWPSLYLLDRSGRIVWSHVGELHRETPAWADLSSRIDAALNAEAPAASP